MKLILVTLILSGLLSSCKNNEGYEAQKNDTKEIVAPVHPGKKLLETHCYVCHAPDRTGHQGRIAPPMTMVQNHYIGENTTKEEFEKDFLAFLVKPSKDIAKMPGAIRNFGLMPYQKFPQDALEQIADYLYENNPLDETLPERPDREKRMRRGMGQNTPLKNTLEQKAEIREYALETK